MRALFFSAIVSGLLLTSCGSKMEQLENAGENVKKAVSNCSLCAPSVNAKPAKEVSSNDQKDGDGTQHTTSIRLVSRLALW